MIKIKLLLSGILILFSFAGCSANNIKKEWYAKESSISITLNLTRSLCTPKEYNTKNSEIIQIVNYLYKNTNINNQQVLKIATCVKKVMINYSPYDITKALHMKNEKFMDDYNRFIVKNK